MIAGEGCRKTIRVSLPVPDTFPPPTGRLTQVNVTTYLDLDTNLDGRPGKANGRLEVRLGRKTATDARPAAEAPAAGKASEGGQASASRRPHATQGPAPAFTPGKAKGLALFVRVAHSSAPFD